MGGLAQLARALAWHARGRRFDPDTLHQSKNITSFPDQKLKYQFLKLCIYSEYPDDIKVCKEKKTLRQNMQGIKKLSINFMDC